MRRGYVDTRAGQCHFYRSGSGDRLVVALPPVPYSGRYFEPLAQALGESSGLMLLCPDPPGYGHSDGFEHIPSIDDYAGVIADVINAGDASKVEILGFHTGALIAMAIAAGDMAPVSKLHLIDVPAFDETTRVNLADKQAPARPPAKALQALEPLWRFNVERHDEKITAERALDLFVDDLGSGVLQPRGFIAAFSCDAFALADRLTCDIHLVATQSMLAEPTRALAAHLEQGSKEFRFGEWQDVSGLVFDVHARRVADFLRGQANVE